MDMLDVDLEAAAAAPDASDAPSAAAAASEANEASTARLTSVALPPASLGRRQRRPRVSKRLQRVLLAKYVARVREWGRLPDRGATEQLLAEGYADLYCSGGGGGGGGGGGVGEPRLSYAAFMKLVRNRRCEFARCSSAGEGKRSTRVEAVDVSGPAGENDQEHQQEIRALIEELDELRQRMAPPRVPQDYGMLASEEEIQQQQQQQQQCQPHHHSTTHHQLQTMMDEAGVPMLSEDGAELAITGDGETDNSVVDGDLSTSESYGSVGSRAPSETVVVSRVQLDQMLQSAQESLRLQKKLLDDVRAIEQRLSGIQ